MAAQYSFVMKGHDQDLPRRPQAGAQQHQPAILSRRQDRHRRPQRRRQVDADEDHGRPRHGILGEAWPGENITVGYLAQEPQLDPTKTVHGERQGRRRATSPTWSTASTPSRPRWAIPKDDTDFDALMAEMGELQEKIDAVDGWTLDNQLEIAMDALRCPPGDCVGRQPVGRREAPRRADPAAAPEARHPAARRADQPPRRRKRPVARKASRRICRQRHPRSPTTATSSTMSSTGSSSSIAENTSSTRAITRPTSRRRPSGSSRKSARKSGRQKAIKRRARVDPAERPRPARPSPRRASAQVRRSWSRRRKSASPARPQILIQVPERLGGKVIEVNGVTKAYGDKLLFEDLSLHPAAGRHRRRDRPQRRRQVDPVQADHRPGDSPTRGEIDIGADGPPRLSSTRAATTSNAKNNVWEEISDGLDYMKVNGHDQSTRAYVGAFNFKGPDQQKKVGQLSGGERNRVHIAKMLKEGGNVLLLDEPTNDLDVETLARARGSDREFRRLRGGHQPRPLLPRPPRDPHPRVRRRQPRRMVRRQFRGL